MRATRLKKKTRKLEPQWDNHAAYIGFFFFFHLFDNLSKRPIRKRKFLLNA